MYRILVINPGSTSTKCAVYEDDRAAFEQNIQHDPAQLDAHPRMTDQLAFRRQGILDFLAAHRIPLEEIDAFVGRGGMLPPVKGGAYLVGPEMVDCLANRPFAQHASNLGGILAYELAGMVHKPAYVYDPVAVDEMEEVAKVTGMPEIRRRSNCHVLNTRAVARHAAAAAGRRYEQMTYIVAHLGGGITIALHQQGRITDLVGDDEGPMSPERAGGLPTSLLVRMCYSGEYDHPFMERRIKGSGGFKAYFGTADAKEVECRALSGEPEAALVYDALCYQVAKGIAGLAAAACGRVDGVLLTGGLAYSEEICARIRRRVEFIAPVQAYPGENEMQALAEGALRVLRGEEQPHIFTE